MLMRPALIALQFLTRFPIRFKSRPDGREVGRSLLFYPAVGFVLGLLIWAGELLLRPVAAPLAGALVLIFWVSSTGAMHLDGLADTADAWIGGRGDRDRTLAIMKDPYSGPAGVAAVVCLLLVKFGALSALHDAAHAASWSDMHVACGCVLPPLMARAAVPMLFAHTPYVREQGIGAALSLHQSHVQSYSVVALTAGAAIAVWGRFGLRAVVAAAVVYFFMRRAFARRLSGITGDCVGAMVEVIEAATIATLAVG